MRKTSIFSAVLMTAMLALVAISSTSCKKYQTRKNISGVWNITEVTIDGTPYAGEVSGTINFEACSGSENRKGSCNAIQDITLTQNGVSQSETENIPYRVLKKGEKLFYGDSEVTIELEDNTLTMLFNEGGESVKYFLSR
jgi:hypothetical protein